jgi:hypothetical protein
VIALGPVVMAEILLNTVASRAPRTSRGPGQVARRPLLGQRSSVRASSISTAISASSGTS